MDPSNVGTGWVPMARAKGFRGIGLGLIRKWREIAANKSEPVTPWPLTSNELMETADGIDRGKDDEKHLSNSFTSCCC